MGQGTFGRIRFGNDFTSPPGGVATGVPDALFNPLGGGIGLIGVNEGVLALTADEPGGVIDITTDTGDNDNHFLAAGTFAPQNGGMWVETRIKIPDAVTATRAAAWVGFVETLSMATPVMPFETDTITTTYNDVGGMVGFGFDSDASVIDWRFAAGDGEAALATKDATGAAGTALGIRCNGDITADRWWVFRVEIAPSGLARGLFADTGVQDKLVLVGETTAALTVTDNFHAAVGIENRSGANERLEVDYMIGEGFREWASD
jgi:predicted secreted protein